MAGTPRKHRQDLLAAEPETWYTRRRCIEWGSLTQLVEPGSVGMKFVVGPEGVGWSISKLREFNRKIGPVVIEPFASVGA